MDCSPQCIEITTRFWSTSELFRWSIANSHDYSSPCLRLERTCNTEIDQFNFILLCNHDIRRFKVTKDNRWILTMEITQHTTYLAGPAPCLCLGNATGSSNSLYVALKFQHLS